MQLLFIFLVRVGKHDNYCQHLFHSLHRQPSMQQKSFINLLIVTSPAAFKKCTGSLLCGHSLTDGLIGFGVQLLLHDPLEFKIRINFLFGEKSY